MSPIAPPVMDDLQGKPIQAGAPALADADWLYGDGKISDIERIVNFGIRDRMSKTWNLAEMPAFAQAAPTKMERLNPLKPGQIHDVTEFVYNLSHRRRR